MAKKTRYSRLAKTETKKARRSLIIYSALTIFMLISLLLYGIGFLSRFADLINSFRSNKPITITDNTPPAPPNINPLPEYTNQSNINLNGFAEAGAYVNIKFNGKDYEIVVDAEGEFNHSLTLKKDENTIEAYTVDKAGNLSNATKKITIIYDTEEPEINIDKPEDLTKFYGSDQRKITIEGTTEPDSSLYINEKLIITGSSGKFRSDYTLEPGENTFNLKSTDQAGNESEKTLTLFYNP